jgi:hypothetical protein
MRTLLALIFTIPLLTACGVTERRAVVGGRDPAQIWAAMKAVAQTPDYYMASDDIGERWIVRSNDVWIDDDAGRIEVYRRLEREIHQPLAKPQHEQREWKFEIVLEQPAPPAEPIMLFRTRNSGVPAHAWQEAAWYFNEVERFLGPMPATPATAPAELPAPAATAPAASG